MCHTNTYLKWIYFPAHKQTASHRTAQSSLSDGRLLLKFKGRIPVNLFHLLFLLPSSFPLRLFVPDMKIELLEAF